MYQACPRSRHPCLSAEQKRARAATQFEHGVGSAPNSRAAFAAGSGSAIRAGSLDYCAVPRSPPVRTGAYRFNQFGDAERCVLCSGQRPQSAVLERWMFATGTRRSGATCAPMPRPRAADSMLSAAMDPITRCLRGVNPGPGPGVGLTQPGLGSPEFNGKFEFRLCRLRRRAYSPQRRAGLVGHMGHVGSKVRRHVHE